MTVTDSLVSFLWLRVPERVVYKIALLTFKVLHGIALEYLGPVVRVADLPGRQSLRSDLLALTAWWCHGLNCPQLALELSRWHPVFQLKVLSLSSIYEVCYAEKE